MRRISFWIMSTLSSLVILFSYHTSTNSMAVASSPAPVTPAGTGSGTATGSTKTSSSSSGSGSSSSSSSSGSTATSSATGTTTSTKNVSGTFTGSQVNTRWGIVQVRIAVTNGKITSSQAIEYPQDNFRDQQINAYALPILNAAAVSAQSANIDAVSGATVTSDGYISSLQSAIDQAHL